MKKFVFTPTTYPSDLSDPEWAVIEPLLPHGNKASWHKRGLVNAVLYMKKTGCQWRFLPREYPPHSTVWSFFRRARDSGLWERLMDEVVKLARVKAQRNASPTYGIIDSQSVKTVSASVDRGIDGGKKRKAASATS